MGLEDRVHELQKVPADEREFNIPFQRFFRDLLTDHHGSGHKCDSTRTTPAALGTSRPAPPGHDLSILPIANFIARASNHHFSSNQFYIPTLYKYEYYI